MRLGILEFQVPAPEESGAFPFVVELTELYRHCPRTGGTHLFDLIICYYVRMSKKQGQIIIKPGINVWPHEFKTAEALAAAGYTVEFVKRSEEQRRTSADVLIDGVLWEMKAPTADNLKAVERNLKRGRWQSRNIVFDSRRMKGLPDYMIDREVRRQCESLAGICRLLYISKSGAVLDIR